MVILIFLTMNGMVNEGDRVKFDGVLLVELFTVSPGIVIYRIYRVRPGVDTVVMDTKI